MPPNCFGGPHLVQSRLVASLDFPEGGRATILMTPAAMLTCRRCAPGRCDREQLRNLLVHSSAGVTRGDRRRLDPDSGWRLAPEKGSIFETE